MSEHASRIIAVVLAGGRVPAPLAPYCTHRALLRIDGRYMLEYVVQALRQAPSVQGIAVVSAPEVLAALPESPCVLVPEGDSLVENMQRGARALAELHPSHLLFITGDIPLITPEAIEHYLAASLQSGAALTYPIITRAVCVTGVPTAKRTYVRIREGTFTGGNAIFTTANLLDDKQALIQDLYRARKEIWRLANILGWSTVLRMLTGTLTLPYLESVGTRILAAPVRAIISPFAEIGFDVDKPEDIQSVEHVFGKLRDAETQRG